MNVHEREVSTLSMQVFSKHTLSLVQAYPCMGDGGVVKSFAGVWESLGQHVLDFAELDLSHTHTHTHTHTPLSLSLSLSLSLHSLLSLSLQTFHHGFPSQPTCLAYDPVQQLLAIGTENGVVLLYPTTAI